MNMVRSMLALKKVPKRFWPEAVNWSNHILNKCPTLTAKNVTLEEAWGGKKKNLMLATLEYLAAWHMLMLYNPNTQKIIISRDVVFGKDEGCDWSNGKYQHVTVDLEANEEIEDVTHQASQNELPENDSLENNSSEPDEAMTRGTRTRRALGWLTDYVTREELTDEENGAHFNLFIDSDPIHL
ncbi:unnamed protein product [Prunus armeniaca]